MNDTASGSQQNTSEARVPSEKQGSTSRRARPPEKWSFRIELPFVRETENGVAVRVRTPADAANVCADLRQAAQEAFVVIDLNAKSGVIDKRLVTLGILDASLIHPREVFRGAIQNNAAAIVALHNLCGAPHKLCYVK